MNVWRVILFHNNIKDNYNTMKELELEECHKNEFETELRKIEEELIHAKGLIEFNRGEVQRSNDDHNKKML